MRKHKNYMLNAVPGRAPVLQLPAHYGFVVRNGEALYDLSRWLSSDKLSDRKKLVLEICAALNRMCRFASPVSIQSIIRGSIPVWFEFLDRRIAQGSTPVCSLSDITCEVLEDFAAWLLHRPTKRTASGKYSYSGARTTYTQIKSVWLECIASGGLSQACIPDNPFPDSNRAMRSPEPYTKSEMRRLLGALGTDLRNIRNSRFDGEQSDRLIVYLLLIAARTGRNPSPIFEMSRDALQPHPIKPETHALLTTYKKRGNNIAVQSVKFESRKIEDSLTVTADIATLIGEVRELTEPLVKDAPRNIREYLWLFMSGRVWSRNDIIRINAANVHEIIQRFVTRHALLSDDVNPENGNAKPLQLTIMRLRKTFASKMWELTGGDLVRTAAALGNHPRVTDAHYLTVTPEMRRYHHFVGICLELELRGKNDDPAMIEALAAKMSISVENTRAILQGKYNTGVGRCSSPMFGKFAPQTGISVCTAFLNCFRCPNQVVMETDLHRLFSFYWLLIRERNILQRRRWHKMYVWVIREIDQVISPRFSRTLVIKARDKARTEPHPMWRDRTMLASTSIMDESET